jgi:MFS superfamily sulfate permease-like transporter
LQPTSLVDGSLRKWRAPDREFVAQGCAQIVGACAAAQTGSQSEPRSFGLLSATAQPRHVMLALAMAAAAAAAPWAIAGMPFSALCGVLLVQGLAMFEPTLM